MINYNLKEFEKNGSIILEDKRFQDCTISEIKCTDIMVRNCEFYNIVFSNIFTVSSISFENCKFYGCTFNSTFIDCLLIYKNNNYSNCCIENLTMQGYDEQSEIIKSNYRHCSFKHLNIKGDFTIQENTIEDGIIEDFFYQGTEIWANQFKNLKFTDTDIRAAVFKNDFQHVIFKRTSLVGTNQDNAFKDCNMSGFTFEEQ
ncbi:hypothetical protein DXB08_34670 [Hungatella hathewayi]|uniref:hypothetical protein n=1 Tax=Hungatella hathewayi TaxID=154046 RepID=UPI000E4439CF|nr:hypothetical protein [Hungatella hathewayi]RGO61177.1 hypothetical protein DXB08_34670 [Hungatella hathewayi]